MNVSVSVDKAEYVPAGHVKLLVRTSDATGQPLSAIVGLSVVDEAVVQVRDSV